MEDKPIQVECLFNAGISKVWKALTDKEEMKNWYFRLGSLSDQTLLKLTHSGLATFPAENPDFEINNFNAGWGEIINTSLKGYLEK